MTKAAAAQKFYQFRKSEERRIERIDRDMAYEREYSRNTSGQTLAPKAVSVNEYGRVWSY